MACGLVFCNIMDASIALGGPVRGGWRHGRGVWEFVLGMIHLHHLDRAAAPVFSEWAQENLADFRATYWPQLFESPDYEYWDDYLLFDTRFSRSERIAICTALAALIERMKKSELPPMAEKIPYARDPERYLRGAEELYLLMQESLALESLQEN